MADVKVQKSSSQQQHQREEGSGAPSRFWPTREFFDPFTMMRRLSEEMDRAFTSTFGVSRSLREAGLWTPPIEVREREGNLEICTELPGMGKDDVKVEVTDQGIVIQGEKRREHEEEKGGIHRSERSYGRFYRMVPLPEGADADKAKAEFKNGVLEVKVPISEQKRRPGREIPIQS
jgi:HSP20 family protein